MRKMSPYLSLLMSDLWSTEEKLVTKKFTFRMPLFYELDTPNPVCACLWVIW